MVMIANSSHLELMADLWKRQLLTAPRGTRISQVGLSTGCVVRPVPVSHSISLHDVLYLILARYNVSQLGKKNYCVQFRLDQKY